MNGEKRYIPNTKPEWGRELPDGDLNSLVDAAGNNYDNGYNFDEKDDHEEEELEKEMELKKKLSSSALLADKLENEISEEK